MAAEEAYPGLPYLVDPAANDLFEDGYIKFLRGKADKVKCRLRDRPHCINIAQGIRGRYLAEPIRVVHNGRKEVHGLHESYLVRYLVDPGVFKAFYADKNMVVRRYVDPAQDVRKVPRTYL